MRVDDEFAEFDVPPEEINQAIDEGEPVEFGDCSDAYPVCRHGYVVHGRHLRIRVTATTIPGFPG